MICSIRPTDPHRFIRMTKKLLTELGCGIYLNLTPAEIFIEMFVLQSAGRLKFRIDAAEFADITLDKNFSVFILPERLANIFSRIDNRDLQELHLMFKDNLLVVRATVGNTEISFTMPAICSETERAEEVEKASVALWSMPADTLSYILKCNPFSNTVTITFMPESSQIRANFTSPDGAINGRATILVANLEDAEPFVGEYSTLLLKLAESFVGNCKSAQFATSDISKNVLNIFAQEGSYLFELTCASIVID